MGFKIKAGGVYVFLSGWTEHVAGETAAKAVAAVHGADVGCQKGNAVFVAVY